MLIFQQSTSIQGMLILAVIFGIFLSIIGWYILERRKSRLDFKNHVFSNEPKSQQIPFTYNRFDSAENDTTTDEIIKICPFCKKTYMDLTLNFCLEDGKLLSSPINIPQRDPEETIISGKYK